MTTNHLADLLVHVNGSTIITIDTVTNVRLRGGIRNPMQHRLTKVVNGHNVMVFSNKKTHGYENMVKRRLVKEGKNPDMFLLGERQWGVRMPDMPIVVHNGRMYLEVIYLREGRTKYVLDGMFDVDPHMIDGFVEDHQEGDQGGLDDKVALRTFSFDSIGTITIDGRRYILLPLQREITNEMLVV